ncbi:MAG TPA: translation initiation factor IF-3 [Candidatus Deferrimicrobiaceae bacterium]|nr:translation initiation factor IF-3 [Candidatus Deferrimicrobiaceae bacterium]
MAAEAGGGTASRDVRRGVSRDAAEGNRQPGRIKEGAIVKESRTNEQIRIPRVRLVGVDGEQLGIVSTEEAMQKARALDLDLVEVAPGADPPVCRIMDYGKFKYMQSKREQEARKKQTVIQVKEIKVRPKTDEHDLNVKIRHIRRFLEDGDKVKVTVRFRGREMSYASQSGFEMLKHIVSEVADLSKVESPPKMEGRTMMTIVAPNAQKRKAGKAEKAEKALKSEGRTSPPAKKEQAAPAEKQEER